MANGGETHLSSMTAVWLLPIVSCIVAASSGAIVAEVLPNPQHALWTVITSYVLWGIGLPLALMVMVIYLQRSLCSTNCRPKLSLSVSSFHWAH